MSLQLAAQHLAQKGRGRDKMLVHMSPREVQGLQSLAKAKGGQLSINPETGLPEAGFLENLLPLVAAAAATYFTAGAATPMLMSAGMGATSAGILAGAGAGALIGGGSAAIQGGDVGQAALTGGIGGALGGAMGAFGGGAETATGTGLNPNMPPTSPGLNPALPAAPTAANAPLQATNEFTGALKITPSTGAPVDPLARAAPASYIPSGSIGPSTPVSPTTASAMETANRANALANANLSTGVGTPPAPVSPQVSPNLAKTPAADKGFWGGLSDWQKAGVSTAGAALTAEMAKQPSSGYVEDEYDTRLKRISPNFRAQEPVQPNPYYRAQYAKEGGLMAAYQAGGPVERMSMANTSMNPQGGLYPQGMIDKTQYAMPIQRPVSSEMVMDTPGYERSNPMLMARGGIADLGSYSDGGRMLKGPGDGMSDSIPATIGGKQPARLADGEFVVPADVVSHLGNGSTDAGAKKLYAMMDRARQARTGKKKQAPAVNTDKFIPRMA
jgi:hypothetical protein